MAVNVVMTYRLQPPASVSFASTQHQSTVWWMGGMDEFELMERRHTDGRVDRRVKEKT